MAFEDNPINKLSGIGPKVSALLEKLNITTFGDLLFHLPFRYQDRTRLSPISDVRVGDTVVIEGVIIRKEVTMGKRRSLNLWVKDGTGLLVLRFFHFNQSMEKNFMEEKRIRAFGEVRPGFNRLEMIHPESRTLTEEIPVEETLTPIYSLTSGITQRQMRTLIAKVIEQLNHVTFPSFINHTEYNLWEGLTYLHNPPPDADLELLSEKNHPWQQALALEEIVAHQITLKKARKENQREKAHILTIRLEQKEAFLNHLPFQLTGAQKRVILDIERDIQKNTPMMRLIQGDVGSGKTVVAAMGLFHAAQSGFQAILMAPTELLAEQHSINLTQWFSPFGISVGYLSGRLTPKQKRITLEAIALGEVSIIIGTHAVFQEAVTYKNLSLIVIDEQHRFGVTQRLMLQSKTHDGFKPHQLMMTATPIPRTLAMIAYADLDNSIIDERPPNRIPVTTTLMHEHKREAIIERLRLRCREGVQAYWVCTLIEESETLSAKAAEETLKSLEEALPSLRIGLLHGRVKPREKEAIMRAFKHHELDILVATTVIEVGVDVPNASIMIIENAERLGLFQLHQLRGRVGRGSIASHCLLLYAPPLSAIGKERLQIMQQTEDGFKIAEKDLELRGAGEILGTKQTGLVQFKMADLACHQPLVAIANGISERIIDDHQMIQKLTKRWLGHKEDFISV